MNILAFPRVWLLQIKLRRTFKYKSLVDTGFRFSWLSGVAGAQDGYALHFSETAKLFENGHPLGHPCQSLRPAGFTPSRTPGVAPLNLTPSVGVRCCLAAVLVCVSPMTDDAELFFRCSVAIHVSSSTTRLLKALLIFKLIFLFESICMENSLYIVDANHYDMISKYFLPVCGLSLYSFNRFRRAKAIPFDKVLYISLFF